MSELQEKLKLLPENPGVYIMLDKDGVVIYVGKARVLKNRVRQYFHSTAKSEKVAAMVENIADFSYIITQTEIDALALENNLIKKYKPKYNILLKDDKTYPYIKVHTKEEFPRVTVTRKIKKDGKYFGPFMGGVRCGEILEVIAMVYQVRTLYTDAIMSKISPQRTPPINGPKYLPSFLILRVTDTRGNSSFVCTLIYGYVLSSFNRILYLGLYFLIRLFSSANASISVCVMI